MLIEYVILPIMNTITFIIIISCIILVGIISFVVDLKSIRKTQQKILDFRNVVISFYEKMQKGNDANKEWSTILATYKEIYRLMSTHCYQPSTYVLVSSVMNHNQYNLASDVACIDKEVVSTLAEYDLEFQKTLVQWWNIFSHFFRGIGTILRIVFQYPIQMIKPDFNFKSKGWNIFSAIIGVAGSIASILSLIFM